MRRAFPIVFLLGACLPLIGDSDPRPESTRKLAALLQRIYREQDWKTDPFKAAERAAYYRQQLQRPLDPKDELQARLALSEQLLIAGESAASAAELEKLRDLIKAKNASVTPVFEHELSETLAIAYL